jgi:hypothetical protein
MAEAFHIAGQHEHENGSSPKRRRLEDDTGWVSIQSQQLADSHKQNQDHVVEYAVTCLSWTGIVMSTSIAS